ncbi:MAG: hypothetical protein R6X02_17965 [Enhygromyxa sp.]
MTKIRPVLLVSLVTLLAGLALTTGVLEPANSVSDDQRVAGIEREGDIPLPIARG